MIKHSFAATTCAAFLSVFLLASSPTFAQADSTSVVYDGNSKSFIFLPNTTDLFDGFKNLMPGDTVSQEITVGNSSSSYDAELFLKADSVDAIYEEMLSEMSLSVTQEGTSSLFEAPASEQDNLADWVSLGIIEPGGQANLLATIKVPEDLSNEHQNGYGEIVWNFKVVEDTIEGDLEEDAENYLADDTLSKSGAAPQTGDATIWIIGGILVVLATAGVVVVLASRKRNL